MTKIAALLCLLATLVSVAVGIFPSNGRLTNQDFRTITVHFDDIKSWNASGKATQKMYEFVFKIKNRPSYFVTSSKTEITPSNNVTIKNLFINQEIMLKVAYKPTPDALKQEDFSQWFDFSVKKASEAGAVVVPGKVQNIKVAANPDNSSTHSAIITFDDPANVKNAQNENDKSVQYIVETCVYNRFLKTVADCKVLTEFLRNMATTSQTTFRKPVLYTSNIHPAKDKELMYKITGVSLNGTKGPVAEFVHRLDAATKPEAPVNLTSSKVYADELVLSMVLKYSVATSVYVEYNIKGNATKMTKSFGSMNKSPSFKITGLTGETEYEFQAGVLTSNGGSNWSVKYSVTTSNMTAPTSAPSTTPSSSNILMSSFCSILFAMVAMYFLNK